MSNESIKLSAVEKKMLNELFWRQNFLMFGMSKYE